MEIRKHEFQADYDRKSTQKLSETIESQQEELHRAQAEERRRQDHQLLHEQLLKQNWDLCEPHEKSLNEMEELKRFQGSTFDTLARRRLVEDQDTILELPCKIQELHKEIGCVNDSKDFQDAESVRSGHSHVTSQPVSFPPHPIPGGMLSRSKGMPSRKDGPPSIWDTHGFSGNVFASPVASSTAPYPQELNPWSSGREEPLHSSTVEKNENQTPVNDCRFQVFVSSTLACWKIRFNTEICTCSQFPTEAMHWIKEVEMVDSVDDLMSSSSVRGIRMPDFEVLDAKIASALNRIIHNSHFKRRISLEEQKAQKEDRFLRGRQIAYLMGSPRQAINWRRRTREGPEPACVQTPFRSGGTRSGRRMN